MDSKFDFLSEKNESQEMGNQNMGVSYHQMNGFKYENGGDKSDSFIVDLQSFSNVAEKENTNHSSSTNSRITLQRSLSRKVSQRGAEKIINDRDPLATSSSPRAAQIGSMPEKSPSPPTLLSMGSQEHTVNNHHHHHQLPQHQITIKTSGINTIPDGRLGRRSSFRRSSHPWFSDPKRILLFFATLSSMGTMLLIYFTLSMSKHNEKEGALDWQ